MSLGSAKTPTGRRRRSSNGCSNADATSATDAHAKKFHVKILRGRCSVRSSLDALLRASLLIHKI